MKKDDEGKRKMHRFLVSLVALWFIGCSAEGPGEFALMIEESYLIDLGASELELEVVFSNDGTWDVEDFFFEVEMYARDTPLRSSETGERTVLMRADELPSGAQRTGQWVLDGYDEADTAHLRLLSAYDTNSGAAYCDEELHGCEAVACLDDVAPCEPLQ